MYYHGTSSELQLGGCLLPPKETGVLSETGRQKNLSLVFFTKDEGYARIYAGRACKKFGGHAVIFCVIPVGEVECLSDKKGATIFVAPATEVVGYA